MRNFVLVDSKFLPTFSAYRVSFVHTIFGVLRKWIPHGLGFVFEGYFTAYCERMGAYHGLLY